MNKNVRALFDGMEDRLHEIVIRPYQRFWKAIGGIVGLIFWIQGLIPLVSRLQTPDDRMVYFFSAFVFWLIFGVLLVGALIWLAFGKQVLLIQKDSLAVLKQLGHIPITKVRTYLFSDIQHLRMVERRRYFKGKVEITYSIKFDSQGREQELLAFLSKEYAESLLSGPLHPFVSQ